MVGTWGYTDPVYANTNEYRPYSDVSRLVLAARIAMCRRHCKIQLLCLVYLTMCLCLHGVQVYSMGIVLMQLLTGEPGPNKMEGGHVLMSVLDFCDLKKGVTLTTTRLIQSNTGILATELRAYLLYERFIYLSAPVLFADY